MKWAVFFAFLAARLGIGHEPSNVTVVIHSDTSSSWEASERSTESENK